MIAPILQGQGHGNPAPWAVAFASAQGLAPPSPAGGGTGSIAGDAEALGFLASARACGANIGGIFDSKVLFFDEHSQIGDVNAICIRDFFKPLMLDVLELTNKKQGSRRTRITGTIGVGKSTFAVLVVYVALAAGRDVGYWSGQSSRGYVFSGTSAYRFTTHDTFIAVANGMPKGSLFPIRYLCTSRTFRLPDHPCFVPGPCYLEELHEVHPSNAPTDLDIPVL